MGAVVEVSENNRDLPPWLQDDLLHLFERHQAGRLPHGIMLEGRSGIGKVKFARFFCQTLLCANGQPCPCGRCGSCSRMLAGSHADFKLVVPSAEKSTIGIDQVREFSDWLSLTPNEKSYRIGIIEPADALTLQAANSLLKTLEEPAPGRLILLICERPASLPATVASRCQRITLKLKRRSVAIDWLTEQGLVDPDTALNLGQDAPFAALDYAGDEAVKIRAAMIQAWSDILTDRASIAKSVAAIGQMPTRDVLQMFGSFVADTIKVSVLPSANIRNSDIREQLGSLHACLSNESWFTLYDELHALQRSDSASFKTHTVLEGIFAAIKLNKQA